MASQPTHTTGPWVIDAYGAHDSRNILVKQQKLEHGDNRGTVICEIEPIPEAEANALLIASAPLLLGRLQSLIDMARSVALNWENGNLAEAVRNLQRVADEADKCVFPATTL